MIQRLSRNTIILLLNNLGTAGLAFVLTIIIGRGLGDVGLGQYATVMAWVLPLTMLADFGVSTLITRDVAAAPHLTRAYVKQALRVRLFFGGGLVALTILLAPFLTSSDEIAAGLRIAACMILIDSSFGVLTAIWRAWETMLPIFLLNALYLTLQVIGALIALSLNAGLNGILLAIVIADGIQLVAAWFVWRLRTHPKAEATSDVPFSAMDFMRKAGPFALAAVLATVQLRMMFQLLEALSSAAVVGWFAAASRFIEEMRVIASISAKDARSFFEKYSVSRQAATRATRSALSA
jgi:O-antigen/teichoic acid export membrane protein